MLFVHLLVYVGLVHSNEGPDVVCPGPMFLVSCWLAGETIAVTGIPGS